MAMATAEQIGGFVTEKTGLRVLSVAPARPLPKAVIQEIDIWAVWTEQGTFYVVDGDEPIVFRRGPKCSSPFRAYQAYVQRLEARAHVSQSTPPLGISA
jgi:hypothetical protein